MRKLLNSKNKRATGILCLLLGCYIAFSQKEQSQIQNSTQQYQTKNSSYNSIQKRGIVVGSPDLDSARYLSDKNPLRAIEFINRAIEKSIRANDKSNEGQAYLILGNIQQKLNQHDLAIENYKKSINVFGLRSKKGSYLNPSNEQTLFSAYKQTAISYSELNEWEKAKVSIDNCFAYSVSSSEALSAKRVLAAIKLKQNQSQESLSLLNEILLQEKQQGNVTGEIETDIVLGEAYLQLRNDDKAVDYFTEAKAQAEKTGRAQLALKANDQLAKIFRKQKNVSKEIETRNSNIAINSNANNSQGIVKENIEIGNAYANTNQMLKAQEYYDKGLTQFSVQGTSSNIDKKLFLKSTDLDETANTYKLLAEEFLKQKNPEKALRYFEEYAKLQDSSKHVRQRELDEAIA